MKSITPAQRYDFSTASVITALDASDAVIWKKASFKMKSKLDTIKIADIVRQHELNLVLEFDNLEPELDNDYIETEYTCCVNGYQAYVEQCVINYYN